jgi:hypothetical protein
MDDFRIITAVGVFHVPRGADALVCFPDTGEPIEVVPALKMMADRKVEAVIHYLPDPNSPLPGMGSCLMGPHCGTGHVQNPQWMLHYHQKGVLVREGFAWTINDQRIPLGQLPGHRARFVVATVKPITIEMFPDGVTPNSDGVEDILQEAAELEDLLQGIRDVLNKERK